MKTHYDKIRNTRACPEDATHGGKTLSTGPRLLWFWFLKGGIPDDGSRSTAVSARGKGLINMKSS